MVSGSGVHRPPDDGSVHADDESLNLCTAIVMPAAGRPAAGVAWESVVDYTADALLASAENDQPRPKIEVAKAFLCAELAHGPVPEADIEQRAHRAQIADMTLKRAKWELTDHPEDN